MTKEKMEKYKQTEKNKTIEDFKRVIANYFSYSSYDLFYSDLINTGIKGTIQNTFADMINLIEKLQKENEKLRNTKNNCPQFNTSGVGCKLKQGDYISKDKIKGKIKEYNKEIKTYEDKMLEITQREKHSAIENKDYIKYSCIISNFTDKIKLLENLIEEE